MRHKLRDDEDGPTETVAIVTAPAIVDLETDVRVRLKIDIRRLLEDRGVDSATGAPTPEQLQAYVVTVLERVLRAKACIVEAHVEWLDAEYQVRALDAERTWRSGVV